MAIALATSPVGATPFTGQDTGESFFTPIDSNGDGIPASHYSSSGYTTLTGASRCTAFIEYQPAPAPSGNCDGVEFSLVPGSWGACRSEGDDGTVWVQAVESPLCIPLSCYGEDGSLVVGCTVTVESEFEVTGGSGIYAGATGSYTTTTTSTLTTTFLSLYSADIEGDITLAGDAPPDDVFLDIPAAGSTQSGISVVSGWSCLGGHLEATFSEADGTPISTWTIPHGASRGDTQEVCGDSANGFSMPINWYHLGPGEKTLTLFVNGEERVRRNFSVTTFGQEFITDAGGLCEIADFRDGQNATFVWEQANQGLVLESLN